MEDNFNTAYQVNLIINQQLKERSNDDISRLRTCLSDAKDSFTYKDRKADFNLFKSCLKQSLNKLK